MTNKEFADKCRKVANMKTLYVRGGWGQPLTEANKKMFITNYSFNNSTQTDGDGVTKNRADEINKASNDTFAFDCSCFIKSVLDGFYGDVSKPFGGATYNKPFPDVNIEATLNMCKNVSTDMSNIKVGEYLVYKDLSHCGIYVGNGEVAECTWRWKDGVQITKMSDPAREGVWYKHGMLMDYVNYSYNEPKTTNTTPTTNTNVAPKPTQTQTAAQKELDKQYKLALTAQKGMRSDYVYAIQAVLSEKGMGINNPTGYFGDKTVAAVVKFQNENGLNPTGAVDYDTLQKLLA